MVFDEKTKKKGMIFVMLLLAAMALIIVACTPQETDGSQMQDQQEQEDQQQQEEQEQQQDQQQEDDQMNDTEQQQDQMDEQDDMQDTGDEPETVTFVLEARNYIFLRDGVESPVLTVNEGDTVIIELTSTEGFHDWTIDEFGAQTQRVNAGGTTSVEFVVDQAGTFEYYCSVANHRQLGMFGDLVVE